MAEQQEVIFTPTDLVECVNQTLEYAYGAILLVGEVASFKVNQGKWVFFDLKDTESSVGCFMPLWSLRVPLEDGMKVVVRATPKLTKWGKFSVTVTAVKPLGEGSIKKAYEKLKKKLTAEGLFDAAKKRRLPEDLARIGVISSTGAAGYADFIKILNARWGGMRVLVAHTQVQGLEAPDQMIRALRYFNERGEVQVIAMIRGGGSADDLSCYNDEALVRAVAASKIPVITGVGHEVDESLCDLAADVRASTPSNAAEMLTRDRASVLTGVRGIMERAGRNILTRLLQALEANQGKLGGVERSVLTEVERAQNATREKVLRVAQGVLGRCVEPLLRENRGKVLRVAQGLLGRYVEPMLTEVGRMEGKMRERLEVEMQQLMAEVQHQQKLLAALNPDNVLRQGYAIVAGEFSTGSVVKITTLKEVAEAKVTNVKERSG